MLKYWDLDRNEMLLELAGHHGEVWALAVSAYGDFVVTGESASDKIEGAVLHPA
jgi:U3 small nucleolar RNA-associated protein 12